MLACSGTRLRLAGISDTCGMAVVADIERFILEEACWRWFYSYALSAHSVSVRCTASTELLFLTWEQLISTRSALRLTAAMYI